MPNDFSASVRQIVQIKLASAFKTQATVNPEITNVPVAGPAILERQTVNATPLFEGLGAGSCVGVEAWYFTADVVTLPTVSGTPIASTCQLSTGDGLSTAKQTYGFNHFQKFTIKINDKECANLAKFMDKTAFLMSNKLSLMAQAVNNTMIAGLDTNKSTATIADVPDGVTINTGNYEIVGGWDGFAAADIIKTLDQLAFVKGLPGNYYIVSGKALSIPKALATDHAANDNERSFNITFSQRDIVNDVKNLDTIIGAEVVYLIDPNAMVNYFLSLYTPEGMDTGDRDNTVEVSVPLRYYSDIQDGGNNFKTLSYMNNGTSTDVRVDIRYQKVCNPVGQLGYTSTDHIWELSLVGLLDFIPAVGDNTGIIRVNKA